MTAIGKQSQNLSGLLQTTLHVVGRLWENRFGPLYNPFKPRKLKGLEIAPSIEAKYLGTI